MYTGKVVAMKVFVFEKKYLCILCSKSLVNITDIFPPHKKFSLILPKSRLTKMKILVTLHQEAK